MKQFGSDTCRYRQVLSRVEENKGTVQKTGEGRVLLTTHRKRPRKQNLRFKAMLCGSLCNCSFQSRKPLVKGNLLSPFCGLTSNMANISLSVKFWMATFVRSFAICKQHGDTEDNSRSLQAQSSCSRRTAFRGVACLNVVSPNISIVKQEIESQTGDKAPANSEQMP